MAITIEKTQIHDYVNRQLDATDWFQVTQEQINIFADCTLDKQYIHVDPEASQKTPFGSTIAHGFLTLSMLSYLSEQYNVLISGLQMGINKRCHAKIIDITEKKPGQFDFITEATVEIQGEDKPALVAEWLSVQMVK